jgi:hypothetical protein
MNRDLHDLEGPEPQRDPVADFFARERGAIRDLPAGGDHWEGLVREARRPVRRAWPAYVAGVAAAAVVVAGVAYGLAGPGSGERPTPAAASRATATVTVTGPATGSSGTGASKTVVPLPAPLSFIPVSLSNGGGGHLFALGSARCAGGPCVAVVGSDDDGATWTTRSSFPDQSTPSGHKTPDGQRQLLGIRFANDRIGYAFGSSAFRTTDGGRSWKVFDVGGQHVLSLETDGRQVWMVTAAGCLHSDTAATRGCTDLQVWTAPVDATSATVSTRLGLAHHVESAWVSLDGADAYVSVDDADPALQTLPMRVTHGAQPLPRPQGCATTGGVWVWAIANTRGALVALCRAATQPASAYAVALSSDSGATWSAATPSAPLGRPDPAGVWLTGVDSAHLVAVPRALPSSGAGSDPKTTLLASSDSGRTWRAAAGTGTSQAWIWAGAAGGSLVYALDSAANGYQVSRDSGASFASQPFRR